MRQRQNQAAASLDRRLLLQLGAGAIGLLAVGQARFLPAADAAADQPALRDGKQLKIHSAVPLNAESYPEKLAESWITPIEQFYVRSNGTTPELDGEQVRLSVEGLVEKSLTLSLAQLREMFPARGAVATLTCAGNRREEHSRIKPADGLQWGSGAIGNARWSGVALADVLKAAGVREGARHVWFESLDKIKRGDGVIPFGASIPLDRAMRVGKGADALIAHTMNEQPLPVDHGFPLRMVVPGYIGARSVKWLARIIVSDRPSDNHYVSRAYKLVTETTDAAWSAAEPILEFPINSVICRPQGGAKAKPGKLAVAGYALPPGSGRTLNRVELSTDGGKTWLSAEISSQNRAYCWCLWRAEVPIAEGTNKLLVRAVDSRGDAQPEQIDWNANGYLHNAWHELVVRGEG